MSSCVMLLFLLTIVHLIAISCQYYLYIRVELYTSSNCVLFQFIISVITLVSPSWPFYDFDLYNKEETATTLEN